MQEEMHVTANVNGRPLTRESTTTGHEDVPVRFYRVDEPPLWAGFQITWIEGDDSLTGATFSLRAGAGCGSRYMTLRVVLPNGDVIHEYVDVSDVLTQRIDAILHSQETHDGT